MLPALHGPLCWRGHGGAAPPLAAAKVERPVPGNSRRLPGGDGPVRLSLGGAWAGAADAHGSAVRLRRGHLLVAAVEPKGRERASRLAWARHSVWFYFVMLGAMLVLLPTTAMLGGAVAAYVLLGLVFWGALALVALVVSDVSLGLLGVLRLFRRLARPRLQP